MYKRDVQVSWSATPTFMRAPYIEVRNLEPNGIAVMGVPTDATKGSRPGARFGSRAIRTSSGYFHYHINSAEKQEVLDVETGWVYKKVREPSIVDVGDLNIFPTDVNRTTSSIADSVAAVVERQCLPILLGGDHYISYPGLLGLVQGLRRRIDHPRVGFIHVDAHLDAKDDNEVMGRHCNSTQVRRISELPEVASKNIALVGIKERSSRDQWDYVTSQGMSVIDAQTVRDVGGYEAIGRAMEIAIMDTDAVYVSLDIDVVDTVFAPGTGAINLGGITSLQFLEVARALGDYPIAALDVVEVAPGYDPGEYTQRLAASAIFYAIAPRILEVKKDVV